jgi:HSP20 family protein
MVDKKRTEEFAEGKRRLEEIGSKLGDIFGKPDVGSSGGVSGFFSGLGNLVEHLGKLAEQTEQAGGEMHKSGDLDLGPDKQFKGVYGFSVKTAVGGKGGVIVEPFGNIKRGEDGKLVEVQQIREPMIDMFDEPDHLLIVAEVPGVTQEDVRLELQDDILIFTAEQGQSHYRKEMLLPASFTEKQMSFTCHNGLLEVRFNK